MNSLTKFEKEKYLLETLERIMKTRSDYRVLYVNISKLKLKNRHPKFVKIITRLFDDLIMVADSSIFVLENGDFAILGKNLTDKIVGEAVDKLREGLITDPIWTSYSVNEFSHLYTFDHFEDLVNKIKDIVDHPEKIEKIPYTRSVDAGEISAIKEHLELVGINELIKHQGVLRLDGPNKFKHLFEEYFVAVKDLSKRFDKSLDLSANKWLFSYLTEFLDMKTMHSFMFSDIKTGSQQISINLNLATVFAPEFDDFANKIKEDGKNLIIEVKGMDIISNLGKFLDAKEILHRHNFKILLDETNVEMLHILNVQVLDPDYVKIFWHGLMGEREDSDVEIKELVQEIGAEKIILAKCLDDKALRWGIRHGIKAFQGPYIDALEVALVKTYCPNAKICSSKDCLRRRRLVAGSFRDECAYKEFLEKLPE